MSDYIVDYSINVDADSHEDAVKEAGKILLDQLTRSPHSEVLPAVFEVRGPEDDDDDLVMLEYRPENEDEILRKEAGFAPFHRIEIAVVTTMFFSGDHRSYVLVAGSDDIVVDGPARGRNITEALKNKFTAECMRVDRDATGDEIDLAFDLGYYDTPNGKVLAQWPQRHSFE